MSSFSPACLGWLAPLANPMLHCAPSLIHVKWEGVIVTPNPPPHMYQRLKQALINVYDDAAPGHHGERGGPGSWDGDQV